MGGSNREITALLKLVDDPDQEVFNAVAGKLLHYGKEIIPRLEALWETTLDESVQERIENLIHRTQFQTLQKDFAEWAKQSNARLIDGALILAKYRYPDLDEKTVYAEIERIKKNVWLELNNYLNPMEQINTINGMIYSFYKLTGSENVNKDPDLFCINYLLEHQTGNSFSLGVLYLTLCDALDIPVFGIEIPRQFILAYFDHYYDFNLEESHPVQAIQFYIDPVNGMVYTHNDVEVYLRKLNEDLPALDYRPLSGKEVMLKMLEELATTYYLLHEESNMDEINCLIEILTPYIQP